MKAKKKLFVLDTNVLLSDASALNRFESHDIALPLVVLEELDKFKKGLEEKNRMARAIIRELDSYRPNLATGAKLTSGGMLTVVNDSEAIGLLDSNDNQIIACALHLKKKRKDREVILVTNDVNVRVKADVLGVTAEEYKNDRVVNTDEMFSGIDAYEADLLAADVDPADFKEVVPNQFIVVKAKDDTLYYRVGPDGIARKASTNLMFYGLSPKNFQQQAAMDLLVDERVPLVSMIGAAGSGKTLLALACALHLHDKGRFRKVLVSKPVIPMGKDIGFLPGDMEEKLSGYLASIFDNLDFLYANIADPAKKQKPKRSWTQETDAGGNEPWRELFAQGIMAVECLTFIRGRSLPNQILIVDEAQQLTHHEIKTILTRAGEGTKIILTGDIQQIDTPYLDETNNGLSYVVERFKGSPLYGHITLTEGVRSTLATEAARLL